MYTVKGYTHRGAFAICALIYRHLLNLKKGKISSTLKERKQALNGHLCEVTTHVDNLLSFNIQPHFLPFLHQVDNTEG